MFDFIRMKIVGSRSDYSRLNYSIRDEHEYILDFTVNKLSQVKAQDQGKSGVFTSLYVMWRKIRPFYWKPFSKKSFDIPLWCDFLWIPLLPSWYEENISWTGFNFSMIRQAWSSYRSLFHCRRMGCVLFGYSFGQFYYWVWLWTPWQELQKRSGQQWSQGFCIPSEYLINTNKLFEITFSTLPENYFDNLNWPLQGRKKHISGRKFLKTGLFETIYVKKVRFSVVSNDKFFMENFTWIEKLYHFLPDGGSR